MGRMTKGQNRGVGSHNAIKLLNDECVELIKATLPSTALTRLAYNRKVGSQWQGRGRDQSQIVQVIPQV